MNGVNREKKNTKKVVRKHLNMRRTILLIVFLSVCLVSLGFISFKYLKIDTKDFNKFLSSIKESILSDKVVAMSSNIDKVYLAIGGTKQINMNLITTGDSNQVLTWKSKNESIASVSENGLITGLSVGETQIEVSTTNNVSVFIDVLVTDLITVPTIGTAKNRKPFLPCGRYTEEEAALLDEILFARVKEAGDGTRGGAVAAARFLLLEFPYEVKYFNENGRMNGRPGSAKIDAEGRYYHKGLYLSKNKFNDVKISTKTGPNIWGCNIYDNMLGQYRPNGLTCSGFVSWALYNGGLDVGDVGAGDYTDLDNELSDLGPHQQITYEFMASNKYKTGDFIAKDGHAALIIGLTEDKIYTAEALIPGLEVHIYDRYKGIVQTDELTYIVNMDEVYPNGEGVYTEMWTSTSTIN